MEQFSAATAVGAWLVDIFPALAYVPAWFPGAGFKRTARVWHQTLMDLADRPFRYVQQQMAKRSYQPSLVSGLLENPEKGRMTPESEFIIKWTAASLYAGGADTTVSTIHSFWLAMSLYPDVQKRAQEEIDRVVGTSRLPTFADRENLPYVEAMLTEALRWHQVTPLALPHKTEEDDIYQGYWFPKDPW